MAEQLLESGVWVDGANGHTPLRHLSESQLQDTVELLTERLAELELALEDRGWSPLTAEGAREFSRQGLRKIQALSRLMFLKNPLIKRAVTLQAFYVFGQGVNFQARHPAVNAVVQAFLDDQKNQAELTSHQARSLKEQELQVTGNLFFVFFTNATTGRVRVRTIPADEVADVISNPDDAKEPWYYKRIWSQRPLDLAQGLGAAQLKEAYYPDWRYRPLGAKPARIGETPIQWETPVYHVKVGGLPDMRFGVPETYAALDWARAYKAFLEDWATITRALAKFAFKVSTKGGAKGVQAAKARLATTVGTASTEHNPPGPAGAFWVQSEGANLDPIRTAGVTTKAEDGRRLLLMVCAATGFPESFFGDVSVGTLATARALDRPTEMKLRDRQTLWTDVFVDMLQFVVDKAALASGGRIKGALVKNDEGDEEHIVLENDPQTGQPLDRRITAAFPPILEHDVLAAVQSIEHAATLSGNALAGTLDARTTTRLLLQALGEPDTDELLARLFPDNGAQQDGDTAPPGPPVATDVQMAEAAAELRGLIQMLREREAA